VTTQQPASNVHIAPNVTDALDAGRAVVALETAVLTRGLPRTPWNPSHGPCPNAIDAGTPLHLATCLAMADAVSQTGATPAVCGILDGQPTVGLDHHQCGVLADAPPAKAAADSMALHVARGTSAGTTVGGTLQLIQAASLIGPSIRWFATGGIGGVHRNWQTRPDVSSDVLMLSRVPCAVVCAGAKSILDTTATVEVLQTLGVPLLGLACTTLPAFLSSGGPDAPTIECIDGACNDLLRAHWSMGGGGVVLVQDPPAQSALDPETAAALAAEAESAVSETGTLRTPALLSDMAERSGGATLRANIALLLHNATTAGQLAQTAATA
jgi:pseudouridine-5'-phosphate glycosidase